LLCFNAVNKQFYGPSVLTYGLMWHLTNISGLCE